MVNRICEDTAGYEVWSTSGSSKRMVTVRVRGRVISALEYRADVIEP